MYYTIFVVFREFETKILFSSNFNPFTRQQILDWSKLKQSADDNSKFDENSRKFFKWVENTVGKGEIACYGQFLLFPQCFQKACFSGVFKGVVVWEWVTGKRYKLKMLMASNKFPILSNIFHMY